MVMVKVVEKDSHLISGWSSAGFLILIREEPSYATSEYRSLANTVLMFQNFVPSHSICTIIIFKPAEVIVAEKTLRIVLLFW